MFKKLEQLIRENERLRIAQVVCLECHKALTGDIPATGEGRLHIADVVEMPIRLRECFCDDGFDYLDEVTGLSDRELLKIVGFGKASLAEFRKLFPTARSGKK